MLVLSRKLGERIRIGDNIEIVINRVSGNRVTLGIEAPPEVRILRGEIEQTVNDFVETETHSVAVTVPSAIGLGTSEMVDYVPRSAR
ncbi:MAG: carbon storage regulator [Blastopirellula sp.]|nr:MAG: carbon storage regulator [Blastopirellula sp.]